LGREGAVIVDAGFRTREERARARATAEAWSARLVIVWLCPSPEQNRAWLTRRAAGYALVSDAGLAVYEKLNAEFEAPSKAEGIEVLQIDPTQGLLRNMEDVLATALAV
jgi:predicted kinase